MYSSSPGSREDQETRETREREMRRKNQPPAAFHQSGVGKGGLYDNGENFSFYGAAPGGDGPTPGGGHVGGASLPVDFFTS